MSNNTSDSLLPHTHLGFSTKLLLLSSPVREPKNGILDNVFSIYKHFQATELPFYDS